MILRINVCCQPKFPLFVFTYYFSCRYLISFVTTLIAIIVISENAFVTVLVKSIRFCQCQMHI